MECGVIISFLETSAASQNEPQTSFFVPVQSLKKVNYTFFKQNDSFATLKRVNFFSKRPEQNKMITKLYEFLFQNCGA